jgi:hypothetical protein
MALEQEEVLTYAITSDHSPDMTTQRYFITQYYSNWRHKTRARVEVLAYHWAIQAERPAYAESCIVIKLQNQNQLKTYTI